MTSATDPQLAIANTGLNAYFQRSLRRAVGRQRVAADAATIHYLANLLTHFSRSENLFDYTESGTQLRPLANLYADAVYSESATERRLLLRRMGDVALFVAGMFSGFVTRRRALVGVDYYIAMGGQAYACLATGREGGGEDVFGQLSSGFGRFVVVLTEVGGEGARRRNRELDDLLGRGQRLQDAVASGQFDVEQATLRWRH